MDSKVNFKIKIAETVVEISAIYNDIKAMCKDYITDEPAEIFVNITTDDIQYELEHSAKKKDRRNNEYMPEYLETLAVYRKIVNQLIERDIILFHGSVVAVDDKAYLFTATSGTGKSTHTRLWCEYFGDRATMVNDDKPLIKISDDEIIVYGTPWDGKHHRSSNISVKLKAVCILERGEQNTIEEVDKKTAFTMAMQQTHKPSDGKGMMQAIGLIDKLVKNVETYKLSCNMDLDAAIVAFEGMNKN